MAVCRGVQCSSGVEITWERRERWRLGMSRKDSFGVGPIGLAHCCWHRCTVVLPGFCRRAWVLVSCLDCDVVSGFCRCAWLLPLCLASAVLASARVPRFCQPGFLCRAWVLMSCLASAVTLSSAACLRSAVLPGFCRRAWVLVSCLGVWLLLCWLLPACRASASLASGGVPRACVLISCLGSDVLRRF